MNRTANNNRMLRIMVTTALTGALVSGCATHGGASATLSAGKAEAALAKGKHDQAMAYAEAAVLAEPRNAAYRAVLGAAYLDAGRFASAVTSFDDAMELGDNSPRTALSLALALVGDGKQAEAAAVLNEQEGSIATADLGLALALAGQPERGVHLLGNAIRSGENTAKVRQNLAYAYALAGRWREARLMASQDVPADQLSRRMEDWVQMARPEAAQQRVATLLQVPVGVSDAGQPARLALTNTPGIEQLAAEASALAPPAATELAPLPVALAPAQSELPAVSAVEVARAETAEPARPLDFQAAFVAVEAASASLASVAQDAIRFVQAPVVQAVPAAPAAVPVPAASRPPQRVTAAVPVAAQRSVQGAERTHLVQLGSFANRQSARRAWDVYVKKYPELSGHQMVISEAVVKGKRYWRVSAAGFGKSSSSAMCGKVRASGNGCFAYSENRPLPGAVGGNVRLARR